VVDAGAFLISATYACWVSIAMAADCPLKRVNLGAVIMVVVVLSLTHRVS
jgi:hypothetical protein